jgi:hypothetical protein
MFIFLSIIVWLSLDKRSYISVDASGPSQFQDVRAFGKENDEISKEIETRISVQISS